MLKRIEERLRKTHPLALVGASVAGVVTAQKIYHAFDEKSLRELLGDYALMIPAVRAEYLKEFQKGITGGQKKLQEKWASFGDPVTVLPENGWTREAILGLINKFASLTNLPLEGKQMSGTIYSASFMPGGEISNEYEGSIGETRPRSLTNVEELAALSSELEDLYTYAFKHSFLWNSLHGTEFGIGDYLSYQVIQMVGSIYGGHPRKMKGFVTSGGTESLMTAMRCYRNWGVKNRGHKVGEGVILAADTVHAAVMKAGMAYSIKVITFKTGGDGRVDIEDLKALVKKVGDKLVAIVGSTPSYPTGVVDPIVDMAAVAKKAGVGMHVDACLGGFIVNFLDHAKSDFLAIPGVTSLSTDTHKNGWAPKGSSVCITQPISDYALGEVNLAYYSVYSIPGWTGGVYGTPKDAGSQACVHTLQALVALLAIGKNGYKQIAQHVYNASKEMARVIGSFPPLTMICEPEVNVVTFKVSPDSTWAPGALYALLHFLDHKGFTVSAIKSERAHFCMTGRMAADPKLMEQFDSVLRECIEMVEDMMPDVRVKVEIMRGLPLLSL